MKWPTRSSKTKGLIILVVVVLAGFIPLEVGVIDAVEYFYAPVPSSSMGFKGFVAGWANPDQVTDVSVDIGIHVPSNTITLNYAFRFGENSTSEFAFILPFPIMSVQRPNIYMNLSKVNVEVFPENLSGSSQLEIVTDLPNNNSPHTNNLQVVITMTAVGDLVSGARGSYILSFPTDVYPPTTVMSQSIFRNANPQGYLYTASPSEYTFYLDVGLSDASVISSVYPPSYKPNPVNFTFSGSYGPTEWLNWNMTGANGVPATIQYQIPTESRSYESDLFWGGMLIAIGVSILVTAAFEYLDPTGKRKH